MPDVDVRALRHLPGPPIGPRRRAIRYWLVRVLVVVLVRAVLRVRLENGGRLPTGPAVLCFSHMNWSDPFMLMAALPMRPRLFFFGPKEEDMSIGPRNRIMWWSAASVPYKPGKNDLVEVARVVRDVFAMGGWLAIAGEGRIHRSESEILPLSEGPAYFALRSGVPVVPVAINGTSWIRFGGRVRVRVGVPIIPQGRPTREAIADLTARTWTALHELVVDEPEVPEPGRFGRWITELFNEWPEGSRPTLPSRTGGAAAAGGAAFAGPVAAAPVAAAPAAAAPAAADPALAGPLAEPEPPGIEEPTDRIAEVDLRADAEPAGAPGGTTA